MKQAVEVGAGVRGAIQAVTALDGVPQRVGVEDETRARHDIGPIAGLVLLQQEEALVLLGEQPLQGELDSARVVARHRPCAEPSLRAAVEEVAGQQPPERGIDAAQVPEIGFAGARLDELRDLAVRGLMGGQGVESRSGGSLEHGVSG